MSADVVQIGLGNLESRAPEGANPNPLVARQQLAVFQMAAE